MSKPTVCIKKLAPSAKMPTYATPSSAGADLYALPELGEITVEAGQTVLVRTGLAAAIPEGYAGLIYARSGLACKRGLAPANKVGVIDADYRGEIMVALHNHGATAVTLEAGERIAQLVIAPILAPDFLECETLDDTVRGEGGFGSTGNL